MSSSPVNHLNIALGHQGMQFCSGPKARAAWGLLNAAQRAELLPILSDRERKLLKLKPKLKPTK